MNRKDLKDFKALSFDCYGTLIDWETGIAQFLLPWAASNGLPLSAEELLTAYSKHEATAEAEFPAEKYPSILAKSLRQLGIELGASVSDAQARSFGASVPDWPAFPDSHEALTYLARKFQLIILSNVDRQSFAGSNKRLDVQFTSILTAEDIGSYKPADRNFEYLEAEIQRLGIQKEQLLHVAQSLFHDHVPAKRRGIASLWINRRHDVPGWGATPDPGGSLDIEWTFNSMADFAAAVASE
jgi:putative hydrolase of the HAD superfamily